ncbi:hypothetical protein ACKWTF_007114 [Chironomus riparius]
MACLVKIFKRDTGSYNLLSSGIEGDTHINNYRKRNSDKKKLSKKQHEHEPQHQHYENSKNERSESGFDSINDGIFNNNSNSNHISLNIPLPPTREPPCPPIETDYTPQQSPVPCRKLHKQPIPDINFIESTPSPIPKGNHFENDYDYYANNFNMKNVSLIENDFDANENTVDVDKNSDGKHQENEIKIDELNVKLSDVNVRKEGIISAKIKHEELEELEIKVYPKDKITERMITSAIVSNDFLCNILDNESIKTVVNAMLLESYDENSFIINEGDSGNFLYVSAEGMFDVIKGGNSMKTFGPGVVFGELSILYKARRFASIKALTFCKVFSLERKVFQKIMMSCGRREREENIKFLSSVSVLKDLPLIVLNKISDLLKREYFPSGSTIIRQGDPGDKFYIIRSGSVNVIKSEEEKGQRLVGILKRGAYFGEQALIHQDKRLASIISNPPGTDCLTLDRNAFDAYLGGLDKIRNTKIVDQNIPKTRKVSSKNEYGNIQLNELKLVGTLGVGGFGRVELVQYKNKITFALKSLKKIEMLQQQQQEHAYNEKEILFECNSPFIVRLYKTYKDRKYLYYLMEPCLGGDVWTILQKYKFFDEKISKFMTACVVLALEYLHSKHIIYRDLKPENLMLDTNGYIKLVDFGFAKFIKPGSKTWTFAGTPEYVAPEIILNKGHDLSSDCWSLGKF